VRAHSAKSNLSHHAKQHLKVCKKRAVAPDPLPPSKRPLVETTASLQLEITSTKHKLAETTEQNKQLATKECLLVVSNEMHVARISSLEEQISRMRAENEQRDKRELARDERHRGSGLGQGGASSSNTVALPTNESAFGLDFVRRALESDSLLRQLSSPKRAVLQLVDLYAHANAIDSDQLELFKKAFASMGSAAAMGVVKRCYGDAVEPALERMGALVQNMERDIPDLVASARSGAAEEALCLMHLHNVCRRVDVEPLSRDGFSALYLGEYTEVRLRFAGYVRVTRMDMRRFFSDEPEGERFWLALCRRCGLPARPYDASVYQIEHILNDSWGGADHYANFMVLFSALNNSAEFRYGPGEVKMITLGAVKYRLVQRFAKWDRAQPGSAPRDSFFKIESEHYALPAITITGERQLVLKECLRGKQNITK
tara:strand:+ start:335 stop:1621 length:1287 start_codon:yes stop_codon:yes gene_type:complete